MANRWFNQFGLALEKNCVNLFGRFTVGATGAPTMDTSHSKGIASIVRNAVGKYTITLSDTYPYLFDFDWISVFATPAAINCFLISQSVSTAGAPTLVIQFQSAAGTNVELANGEDIRFNIVLSNSSAF